MASKKMKVKLTRAEAKAASREALVQSAIALIPEVGLDVSLDDICAHAGYTRGAFYLHFKNREELTLEIMNRAGEKFLSALFGIDASGGSKASGMPKDLVELSNRFLASLASGDYPISKKGIIRPHQLLDSCVRSDAVHDQYQRLAVGAAERLAMMIGLGQKAGSLRGDIPSKDLSEVLVALVVGIHTLYDLDFPFDFSESVPSMLKLLQPKK